MTDLTTLGEPERQRILFEWNQLTSDYPHNRCLHEFIEDQAKRTPQDIAVVCGQQRLTYCQLNQRSNQLAYYLQELGVTSEYRVAIDAVQSVETPIAILAVLKAGGAYVPLDPNFPPARLHFMVRDSQATIFITSRSDIEPMGINNQKIVSLVDWSVFNAFPVKNLASSVNEYNLAYIIYTSGSTGQPKGVLVPHRQIVDSTCARLKYDHGYEPTAFLLLLSFSFDASGCGMYWTWFRGGRLVIPTAEQLQNLAALRDLAAVEQITHLDCAPSFYTVILENASQAFQNLRHANVGGENCLPQLVEQHYQLLPQARLVNDYGPTETTIWSTRFECLPTDANKTIVPIGRPIPNVQIYILDEYLHPLAIGIQGELYISGGGVARGYLNQPELTAERFIPNPYTNQSGMRMYKTGDLARYLPDGNIEFLGRNDQQIKMRGYRIEISEIETTILSYPALVHGAVIVTSGPSDQQQLIAYLVARDRDQDGYKRLCEELMVFLRKRLPHYMLPTAFEFLEDLPRSPTGKIDRQALQIQVKQRVIRERPLVMPRTFLEQKIALAISAILEVDTVSIDDNFFDLGANSITIARIMGHLTNIYGIHLPAARTLENPTIAGVTKVVDAYQQDDHYLVEWGMKKLESEALLDLKITPEWNFSENEGGKAID